MVKHDSCSPREGACNPVTMRVLQRSMTDECWELFCAQVHEDPHFSLYDASVRRAAEKGDHSPRCLCLSCRVRREKL